MRLIIEVPLPLALSSALISCTGRQRWDALGLSSGASAIAHTGPPAGACTHPLDLPDLNLLVGIGLVPHGCLLLRLHARGEGCRPAVLQQALNLR